jgi:hypothetical protein
VRLVALVLLICYPFILWRLSRSHGLLAVLTPALFLWAASVLLLWTSSTVSAPEVAVASVIVLASILALLLAVADLHQGSTADGVLNLIAGVGFSLVGASLLRGSPKLAAVGVLLAAAFPFLLGARFLAEGNIFGAVICVLACTGTVLGAVAVMRTQAQLGVVGTSVQRGAGVGPNRLRPGKRRRRRLQRRIAREARLGAVALLLLGAAILQLGLSGLLWGFTFAAVATLLVATGLLLLGIALVRRRHRWMPVTGWLLLGLGFVLLGVATRERSVIGAVLIMLVGVSVVAIFLEASYGLGARLGPLIRFLGVPPKSEDEQ